jgi:hypothetical protein
MVQPMTADDRRKHPAGQGQDVYEPRSPDHHYKLFVEWENT